MWGSSVKDRSNIRRRCLGEGSEWDWRAARWAKRESIWESRAGNVRSSVGLIRQSVTLKTSDARGPMTTRGQHLGHSWAVQAVTEKLSDRLPHGETQGKERWTGSPEGWLLKTCFAAKSVTLGKSCSFSEALLRWILIPALFVSQSG